VETIFVSSVQKEFAEERRAIRDFVAGEGTRAGAGPEKRAASGNPATLLG